MPKMHLLARGEARPPNEAKVWFSDGLRLIQAAPWLWLLVSLSGVAISFAALLAGGIFAAILPLLGLVPMVVAQCFIQAGMLMICAKLAAGTKAEMNDFFAAAARIKNRSFLQLCLFILTLDLILALLQSLLFPQPLVWIENEQMHMAEAAQIYQAAAFMVCAQTVILFLTWAILPILVEFPRQSFKQLLALQFDGMASNLKSLIFFGLLCSAALSAAFFTVLLIAQISSLLGFLLLIVLGLWGWPLLNAWTFSAVRHIFMDW